jgi:hypothetical protein
LSMIFSEKPVPTFPDHAPAAPCRGGRAIFGDRGGSAA